MEDTIQYSRIFGSDFPNSISTLSNFKEIGEAPTDVQELIKQFYSFIDEENNSSAAAILESNWEKLKPYYIGMDFLNKIEEEVYNIGVYVTKMNTPTIVSDVEPTESDYLNYTAWLKPIN